MFYVFVSMKNIFNKQNIYCWNFHIYIVGVVMSIVRIVIYIVGIFSLNKTSAFGYKLKLQSSQSFKIRQDLSFVV